MDRFLSLYESFLIKNASQVSSIESTLRTFAYILPGRFKDTEIASETIYSGLSLVGIYHDSILAEVLSKSPKSRQLSCSSRVSRFMTKRIPLFRRLALLLTVIQSTELLAEMVSKRKGSDPRTRWRTVVSIEAIKAICRLLLIYSIHRRPLPSALLPERQADPSTLDSPPSSDESSSSLLGDQEWKMPRTGRTLGPMPASDKVNDFLMSKVLTFEDVASPGRLIHPLHGQSLAAEVLYILRPLIYALFLYRLKVDKKGNPWTPWAIGFGIEYLSRTLVVDYYQSTLPRGLRSLSQYEREQLEARRANLKWWALRGAFYDQFTGPLLERVSAKLSTIPVIDLVGTLVGDYHYLFSNYYFASSTL